MHDDVGTKKGGLTTGAFESRDFLISTVDCLLCSSTAVILSGLVRERMRAHNQRHAHTLIRLFIVVQNATLRSFNYHSLRPPVCNLQAQLP
jgi:hypothetical protein